jgi:hypothetical protein
MIINKFYLVMILGLLFGFQLNAQVRLDEINHGSSGNKPIWKVYIHSEFEDFQELKLYRDKSFHYQYTIGLLSKFFKGKWEVRDSLLILVNDIDRKGIPTKIKYEKNDFEDTTGMIRKFNKGPFLMPRNKKGELFWGSEILINNDSIRYSPFFDSIFGGNPRKIERIKVNYVGEFFSGWLNVKEKRGYKILPVGQIPFLLSGYDAIKIMKFRISGTSLIEID